MYLLTALLLIIYFIRTQSPSRGTFNAYVFYATQDTYACSTLINVFNLYRKLHTKHQVIVFLSEDVSSFYYDALEDLGVTIYLRSAPPLHLHSIPYYQGCLLKLMAFELSQLDQSLQRVVVMDSDQLILRDLDSVFELPGSAILAPKAYWIDDHTYSSTFMLFEPSFELWDAVSEAMQSILPDTYDMDLINDVLGETLEELPATYGTLNSHWEDNNIPHWFAPAEKQSPSTIIEDLQELYAKVHVIHLTAVGKPWMYDVAELRELRPYAHPILVEQWGFWRASAKELCVSGIIDRV